LISDVAVVVVRPLYIRCPATDDVCRQQV